ncbi:MAG TPA: oligosaccharide flippase family protein [Nitrospiraceae bacterium]|nr:oligosaccharide flippase family protein [Nitrospiraceae bacterium]
MRRKVLSRLSLKGVLSVIRTGASCAPWLIATFQNFNQAKCAHLLDGNNGQAYNADFSGKRIIVRELADYAFLLLGRVVSAASGYLILAYSANYLEPIAFSELSFYQALQFLTIIALDSGTTQAATRYLAGECEWRSLARSYQGLRTGTHGISAMVLVVIAALGFVRPDDELLPFACALALLSNTFNADWLLIALDWRRVWATKTIIVGLTNALSTILIFHFYPRSSVVFIALSLANLVGALYLRWQGLVLASKPRLPSSGQLHDSFTQSVASMATHTAYNLPLLSATSLTPGEIGGAFACLYRIFSASTLFVPLITDFAVARLIARSKSGENRISPLFGLTLILANCGAAVVPFLLTPNHILFDAFAATIHLSKFDLSVGDFLFYKISLFLYCLEFGLQRLSYAVNNNRAMAFSTISGLIACIIAVYLLYKFQPPEGAWWFVPLYVYQLIVIMMLMAVPLSTRG